MNFKINERQLEAISAELKPCLVLSGAGTGKTFVLTKRISYLINHYHILPSRIWGLTFTNKASVEIQTRVKNECGFLPKHIATFHKSCIWILRKHIQLLNRKPNFKIIGNDDQITLVRRIIKNLNFQSHFEKKIKPKVCLEWILYFKRNDISLDVQSIWIFEKLLHRHKIIDITEPTSERSLEIYHDFIKICRQYCDTLVAENLIDLDDILIYAVRLLKIPEVLKYWQNAFDAILIDEFQDTDPIQFKIVKLISAKKRNVFVVGDPDQSIYAWRGASPSIISDFLKLFPEAKTILLEENYRSTQKILNVSNTLIDHNSDRIKKRLFTKKLGGENIFSYYANDNEKECKWICQQIKKLMAEDPEIKYNDITILYRNNFITKKIEEHLINNKIPYVVFNGVKFYQREEIKTLISYLNLVLSNDPISIENVCNLPRRGIADKSFETIYTFASIQKINLYQAFEQAENIKGLSSNAIKGAKKFCETIEKIRQLDRSDVGVLIWKIFEVSGYKDSLDPYIDAHRFENVESFMKSLSEIQINDPSKKLEDILDEITLFLELNQENDQGAGDRVNLMTIHGAKGLEFPYVFVIHMTESIFPSKRNFDYFEQIEEERRLAYVAFTRAIKRLFISSSKVLDFATNSYFNESRFFLEAEKCNDVIRQKLDSILDSKWKTAKNYYDWKDQDDQKEDREENHLSKIDPESFYVGAMVRHEIFGAGKIVKIFNISTIKILKIKFISSHQEKDIVANNPKISFLKN
ncbi:ATP-dependent DNA helicase UvrD/PcrA [[Mycoplasma] cavipharyngis]|uniref:ATP-dependent helicase n=1 Tax=[Mycoplasma] cavipharyngis TaxID=92757 RepID=UPI003704C55F